MMARGRIGARVPVEPVDPLVYAALNPDMSLVLDDELIVKHYERHGAQESRELNFPVFEVPHPLRAQLRAGLQNLDAGLPFRFSEDVYRRCSQDLRSMSSFDLCTHCRLHGLKEGRCALPPLPAAADDGVLKILCVSHASTHAGGAPAWLLNAIEDMERRVHDVEITLALPTPQWDAPQFDYPVVYHFNSIYVLLAQLEIARPHLVFVNSACGFVYVSLQQLKSEGWLPRCSFQIHERPCEMEQCFRLKSTLWNALRVAPVTLAAHYLLEDYVARDLRRLAVWPNFLSRERRELLARYNAGTRAEGRVRFVCVGSISERKGTDIFMGVARLVPNADFVWIGGPRGALKNTQNFRHVCHTDNPFDEMLAADFFLHTSRREPNPTVRFESLYIGLPYVYLAGNVLHSLEVPDEATRAGMYVEIKDHKNKCARVADVVRTLKPVPLETRRRATSALRQWIDREHGAPLLPPPRAVAPQTLAVLTILCDGPDSPAFTKQLRYWKTLLWSAQLQHGAENLKIRVVVIDGDGRWDAALEDDLFQHLGRHPQLCGDVCRRRAADLWSMGVPASRARMIADRMSKRVRHFFPTESVLVVPNRGLDVGPFLLGCRLDDMLPRNRPSDFVMKLHSKSNDAWRELLARVVFWMPHQGADAAWSSTKPCDARYERSGDWNDERLKDLEARGLLPKLPARLTSWRYSAGNMFSVRRSLVQHLFEPERLAALYGAMTHIDADDEIWRRMMRDGKTFADARRTWCHPDQCWNEPLSPDALEAMERSGARNYIELKKRWKRRGVPDAMVEHALERYFGACVALAAEGRVRIDLC
jgi:glycosyltransferase involved in cell wall biosynthesis